MCSEPEYEYDITFYPQTSKYVWTCWSSTSGKFLTGGTSSSRIDAITKAESHIHVLERNKI